MATPPKPHPGQALYDEYLDIRAPDRAEIIDGTLYVSPRPAPRHANATTGLGSELRGPFQRGVGGPGGWWILFEPELQLRPLEPMAPDLAGWRVERMPELPDTAYFSLAPDWVCEVLSRSTAKFDRDKKLPFYAAHGVTHVWLVDPVDKILEVHALADHRVRVYEGDVRVRADPFGAIEIDLAALWSPPRPA